MNALGRTTRIRVIRALFGRDWRTHVLMGALVLTGITLTEPVAQVNQTLFNQLIVFDITQSMNVADVGEPAVARYDRHGVPIPHTRLSLAKDSLIELLDDYPCGSTIGVSLFTGHRSFVLFTPVEVCAHYGELRHLIAAIDWRMAWEARSEVTKGVHSAMVAAKKTGENTTIVFLTDGHEAPPLNPEFKPTYRGEAGDVQGLIVGVGGTVPAPIPKLDQYGRQMGFFSKDEVLQVDTYSLGRFTSVDESMTGVADSSVSNRIANGTEHLSSLRNAHLQALAAKLSLGYTQAVDANSLAPALFHPSRGATAKRQTDSTLR